MKKLIVLFITLFCFLNSYSQENNIIDFFNTNKSPDNKTDNFIGNIIAAVIYNDLTSSFTLKGKIKVDKDIFGRTILEDKNRHKITISKDVLGNIIIEDNEIHKITIENHTFGSATVEDYKGNKIIISKDASDDIIIQDNKGNKKTIKEDIFGNIIIEE